jgi:hypothetical protein
MRQFQADFGEFQWPLHPASKHLSLRVDVGRYSIGCKYFWGRGRGNARRVFFEHKA